MSSLDAPMTTQCLFWQNMHDTVGKKMGHSPTEGQWRNHCTPAQDSGSTPGIANVVLECYSEPFCQNFAAAWRITLSEVLV